ncbi:class II aldolase/adducin family protein [Roseovarius aestuarii]|uniref:Decarboxylase NovR n=1 Tax=Roseovarius aestuarii TaxID=475083 RepID=A0A1X7BZ17_9RHOB|nr:class II aldolase/adducin family protein [Roseovarius aestuarii]SMC14735.1 Decarboxylase NovR [Roseovarius aestuarii]
MPATPIKTKAKCSAAEWTARVELAASFRIIAQYGMSDLANGAICARVPNQPDHYLVHPYGMFWEEARASDMVKIDAAGQPVDPDAPWLNDGVQNLCQWILGSRSDANFFVHGHEEEVMAVGSIEDGILPLNQPAVYLGNITGYIEYEFEEDDAFGQHFVKQLGANQILISRNHGYYALGDTAAAAFFRAYFLRQTCSTQIKTLSMGREPHLIDPQKVARYQDQMAASDHYNYNGKTEWPGLLRMLDRQGSDHAT